MALNIDDECLSDTLRNTDCYLKCTLKTFCNKNVDKIIFAHLNINSIRNKFDQLSDMVNGNIDVNIDDNNIRV